MQPTMHVHCSAGILLGDATLPPSAAIALCWCYVGLQSSTVVDRLHATEFFIWEQSLAGVDKQHPSPSVAAELSRAMKAGKAKVRALRLSVTCLWSAMGAD